MSKGVKLIKKLKRREKYVHEKSRRFDKINKLEETLQKSPRAMKLLEGKTHKIDRQFQADWLASKIPLALDANIPSLDRHDFGVLDFGLRFTLPSPAFTSYRYLTPGDLVELREGQAASKVLTVASRTGSVVRLEDVNSFSGTESNIACRFLIHSLKKSWV